MSRHALPKTGDSKRQLWSQAPSGFQGRGDFISGEDDVLGDAADAVGAGANVVDLSGGHGAAVAADATAVAGGVGVAEARGRGEIKGGECARLAERVADEDVSIELGATIRARLTGWA